MNTITHKISQKTICFFLIVILGIICFSIPAYSVTNTMIKIGLESVYKDASVIELRSEDTLLIGYYEDGYFKEEGDLGSNYAKITKANNIYYTTGENYSTYYAAKEAMTQYTSPMIIAYLEPDTYTLYTTKKQNGMHEVPVHSTRIQLTKEDGSIFFVSENNTMPLVFQGKSISHPFPVTQVGQSRKYRGAIGVVNGQKTGLTAFNTILIEEYLYGVIPCEMVASWPQEALKAQAVAARSISLYQYNRYNSRGYNLVDTTATQVYKGVTAETPYTTKAVEETKGEVIKYQGKIAEALYFSTSGGYTESAVNVWGNNVPYLVAMPDIYETKPEQKSWSRNITLTEIDRCLANKNINIGQAQGMKILSRTSSGRVAKMQVIGTAGTYEVNNEQVRTFFSGTNEGSLKSRLFSFEPISSDKQDTKVDTEVMILSANDLVKNKLANQYVMSNSTLETLPNSITIQTETGVKTFENAPIEGQTRLKNTETFLGDMIIYGEGFGHGVGMSQSGARGMAEAGYTYDQILQYYYQGVTIER